MTVRQMTEFLERYTSDTEIEFYFNSQQLTPIEWCGRVTMITFDEKEPEK